MLFIGGFGVLLFAAPMLWYTWMLITGRERYDGQPMLALSLLSTAAFALIACIPHRMLIDDGYVPKFTHEKNTQFTFWWLVITLSICATLLALAPVFPLADGYGLSDTGISFGREYRRRDVALWIAAAPIWAVSALLFYFIGRGLWWHYRPAEQERGDPALQAIEALVPPLRGTLNLSKDQRKDRAQRVWKRIAEQEKRPEGSLNLPPFVTMLLWVSTGLLGLPLPSLLMSAWPANVRYPLGGLVVLAVIAGWVTLTTRLREPGSWLVQAGLGGVFLVTALLLMILNVAPPLRIALTALFGAGHLSVGLLTWFRRRRLTG